MTTELTQDVEPFWNRRWALFEDEDHSLCVVTDDEKAEYVVWPEMTEGDYRRVIDAHNTVLNAALASSRPEPLDVERLLARLACEDPEEPCDQDGRDKHRWCENCIARTVIAREYDRLGDEA